MHPKTPSQENTCHEAHYCAFSTFHSKHKATSTTATASNMPPTSHICELSWWRQRQRPCACATTTSSDQLSHQDRSKRRRSNIISRHQPRSAAIVQMILSSAYILLLALTHQTSPSFAGPAASLRPDNQTFQAGGGLHSARELVRRNTSPATPTGAGAGGVTAAALGNSAEAIGGGGGAGGRQVGEIALQSHHAHHNHPQVPANYVRLGNTTSSHVVRPSNLVQLQPSSAALGHSPPPLQNVSNGLSSENTFSSGAARRLPEKICIGTSNRLSGQSNKTDQYQNLVERYRNCTHVIGNLEITWLGLGPNNKPLDLTFLESIREITGYLLIAYVEADKIRLPNLLIIRGREVFKINNGRKEEFAMFVIENEIKHLEMPNLREIISGNVGFYNNRNLCYINTIDWVEILNTGYFPKYAKDSSVPEPKCGECHQNCQAPSCWGPEENSCQRFSKTTCPPQCETGRCYGQGPRDCCHMMCAGGCTGPKQTDCFACKNFNNEGECVPECPPMNKYNPSRFLWEPDPNGKHAYGASCVKECPEHLLRDNGACVRSCPPDKRSLNGECVPCAGPCPKNCQGVDVVNSRNIEQLVNCTEIEGSITILDTSFDGYTELHSNNTMGMRYEPMHPSRLQVLGAVRKITGYLNIQADHSDFKDLAFLSKLETIDGRQTTDMFHSLSIIKTSLRSLNLRSLKRVRSGRILIEENKELCYAEAAQFARANIAKAEDIIIRNNGDDDKCLRLGQRCHEQCAHGGCWGAGQNECLACKNYKLDDYCVNDCAATRQLDILSYDAGDRTCGRCHQECRGGCSGVSARNCRHCRSLKDGPYCVPECPKHKYNDNGVCQECSKRCVDGCTGPADRLGQGGCNVCDKFIVESTANNTLVASCIKADEPCPRGYYQEYGAEVDKGHPAKALERKPVCKRCHRKCKSCSGYGTHKDVCECAGYMANDQCEDTCPRDSYPDEKLRKCLRCSRECNGCFGPSEADCLNCRVYRLYYDSTPNAGPVASARVALTASTTSASTSTASMSAAAAHSTTPSSVSSKQQGKFNCTSQCPPEKPHRISESNLIDPYCSEDPGADPDNPRIVSIGSTSFLFVLIVSAAIMFCVSIYRCQIEKHKTFKLTMQLSGIGNDAEPVEESNVKPNLAPLRSIKETDLRRGIMLGSGFGGTVYQGLWFPDGQKSKLEPVVCAIKVLRDNGQANMNKEFLDEAYIMASVDHKNLVKLLAVCMTPKQLMLITQFMPLGCLRDYVKLKKRTGKIEPKLLLEWGKQIAQGMAYLEEHRMVHRDLALRNVLIQRENRVLISDFGLAKLLDVDQSAYESGGGRLPIKWLAPECIQEKKFTHKSDVWAFGVTIWELLTFGRRPYSQCKPEDVPREIEAGTRLEQPRYVTAEVYKILFSCWFNEPESRPDFKSLVQDFVCFARDPERYLSWNTTNNNNNNNNGAITTLDDNSDNYDSGSDSRDDEEGAELEGDEEGESPTHSRLESHLLDQRHRITNELLNGGFELRQQHNSDSTTLGGLGHLMGPPGSGGGGGVKMGMFVNSSCQPLMGEDVFLRSSQQISSKSSNMTITDPNNNFGANTSSHGNTMRLNSESWCSVGNTLSTCSLGHRSEQPTDADDYLMPSPCSNEEKYAKFYERQGASTLVPSRPRPPSSRDPPHSAGLIGISNDAYFIARGTRHYATSNCATNASSGNIPSSLV